MDVVGQLFVETLVLTSVAAAFGLIAADSTIRWGMEEVFDGRGGAPFWITPGLKFMTILYAGGLARRQCRHVVAAAGLLRATRARVQAAPRQPGQRWGATLRFGGLSGPAR